MYLIIFLSNFFSKILTSVYFEWEAKFRAHVNNLQPGCTNTWETNIITDLKQIVIKLALPQGSAQATEALWWTEVEGKWCGKLSFCVLAEPRSVTDITHAQPARL